MAKQLDLFAWADARPSNVVDIMPVLIRRASLEASFQPSVRAADAQVIQIRRTA